MNQIKVTQEQILKIVAGWISKEHGMTCAPDVELQTTSSGIEIVVVDYTKLKVSIKAFLEQKFGTRIDLASNFVADVRIGFVGRYDYNATRVYLMKTGMEPLVNVLTEDFMSIVKDKGHIVTEEKFMLDIIKHYDLLY